MKKLKSNFIFIILISTISIVNAQNPQWINYTKSNSVYAFAEEGENMWVGTDKGLLKLDKITGNTTRYDRTNSGLPSNDVRSIAIDENNTKWIGTYGGGLAKFDGNDWTVYNTSNSLLCDNHVWSLLIDENNSKWIGTYDGLSVYNEDGIPVYIDDFISTENQLKIYPNPVSQILNIESNSRNNISYVDIFDIRGIRLNRIIVGMEQKSIDISGLPKGIYVIQVHSGKDVSSKKFIKQ